MKTGATSIDSGGVAGRVLVVDDEFDIAYTYSMLLEFHGFQVCTARNGKEALDMAMQETPDVVVSDYMMPVMDGGQLCLDWRANPVTASIPFILTSAGRLRDDIALPYDAFLRKPVIFDELLAVLRGLIAAPPARR